jgi:hypothetical protein
MLNKNYSLTEENEGFISETGNWNVAFEFVRFKIMKPLYNCDDYSRIATLGYTSLPEELINNNFSIDELKIKGFKWLLNELLLLIDNSLFAVKKPADREALEKYYIRLKEIKEITPSLYKNVRSEVKGTSEIKIIEEKYSNILDRVIEIKKLINIPLNKSHLIFTDREEFDPIAFKNKIKERMINEG